MDAPLHQFLNMPQPVTGLSGLALEEAIHHLRRERNAVILAHYYQDGDIQYMADFVGDSLDLSRRAAATDKDVIVFSGVRFMAEVAKILSPEKIVVLPDLKAGCSLETSCPPQAFRAFRDAHPDHLALTYINCSAEVKAMSDIIVTSSNAESIIRQLPESQPILFAPDRHLGAYLNKKTGRSMLLWPGACIVHERFSEQELVKLKTRLPDAVVAAHPECPENILNYADHIGSTSSLVRYVCIHPAREFIIATEPGILYRMQQLCPDKRFYAVPGIDGACACNNCPYMRLNTMEKLYACLRDLQPRIELPEALRLRALKPLEKMLELSPRVPADAQAVKSSVKSLV